MMNRNPCNKTARGFSLVEVLISMAVFAVTAMGLVALNKVSMDASVFGRERTAAANLAQFAMTWLHNEVSSYAPSDSALGTITGGYVPMLDDANGDSNWRTMSGSVLFDEYLANSTDAKYATSQTAKYCIHYRILTTSGFGSSHYLPGNLYHASVMITWPRAGGYTATWDTCSTRLTDAAAEEGDVPAANYNSLVLTQILTRDFSNQVEQRD